MSALNSFSETRYNVLDILSFLFGSSAGFGASPKENNRGLLFVSPLEIYRNNDARTRKSLNPV